MKLPSILGAAFVLASTLTGCVVAPMPEPVVYGPPPRVVYASPPPPPVVVVRPAYGYYYHRHGPYWHRYWR